MKQLLAIGEALIDFAPEETGKELKDVSAFKPKVGGAPANVCGAYVKLGGEAAMITQLGMIHLVIRSWKSFRTAASDATMSAEPIKRILLWHSWH